MSSFRMTGARYDRATQGGFIDERWSGGRGNLIECPRPGCPTLSGVVAAT
jgi:hypothetical protein